MLLSTKNVFPNWCVPYWNSVRENKDLYKVAHLYVLRNFEEIAVKSSQLMELPVEELYSILNDDLLNVKDEYLVWQCILRWIEHDRETRKMQISKLLSAIRLGCLNATVCTSLYFKTD